MAQDSPAVAAHGRPVQILSGRTLGADGHWQIQFNWENTNGEPKFTGDHGRFRLADNQLVFTSDAWGDQFEGEVDGGVVWLYYDFCSDAPGEDLDLAFSR